MNGIQDFISKLNSAAPGGRRGASWVPVLEKFKTKTTKPKRK